MRRVTFLNLLVVTVAIAAILATSASSQYGAPKVDVYLQNSTPGVSQSGHANISGTFRSGRVLSTTADSGPIVSGVNTSNAAGSSGLYGESTATSATTYGVLGRTSSSNGIAVYGGATSTIGGIAVGVQGISASQTGRGVIGVCTNTAGQGLGVYGVSYGPTGHGGFFWNLALTGDATGVGGQTDADGGRAVRGLANSFSGTTWGGHFTNYAPAGGAVFGTAQHPSGSTYGGFFQALSPLASAVYGQATASTGSANGVYGESAGQSGRGVYGLATGQLGRGVFGQATSSSGPNFGVFGTTAGTFSSGVFGENTLTSGTTYGGRFEVRSPDGRGISATNTSASGTAAYAGYFNCASSDGYGVYAQAGGGFTTSYGVFGDSPARFGVGVYGRTMDSTTSWNLGVIGESRGTQGTGVGGVNTALTGPTVGVSGQSDSNAGRGVYGYAASTSGTVYGVAGAKAAGSAGFAVFAQGDVGASGTKPFRIDHPFDPENKYLLHYATESPTPQNTYSGSVVTDANGYAWVQLPDYFEEINANFKYQLTVVDDPNSNEDSFPLVKVRRPISGNRFQIRSSVPGVTVSWRVEADRNDAYVRAYRPKTEVEKDESERGKLQHPELYGQPKEKGLFYSPYSIERSGGAPKKAR